MGYRHYFYLIEKEQVEKLKDMDLVQINKLPHSYSVEGEDWGVSFWDNIIEKSEEIFNFGKLYWDDTAQRIEAKGVPLFSNEEVMNSFGEDYNPYVMGKEGLLEAIQIYQEKSYKYYLSLCYEKSSEPEDDIYDDPPLDVRLRMAVVDKVVNLSGMGVSIKKETLEKRRKELEEVKEFSLVDTDVSHKRCIANSYNYDYSVFNLAFLLKTIDWEKYDLLFLGH